MEFDPNELIGRLPPFDPQQPARPEDYPRYCERYGFEFGDLSDTSQLGMLEIDAEQIAVHLWRHPSPIGTLLIVHGYLDHHGLYRHLIRYGLERRVNLLCFDLPGHGLSTGKRAAIDSFDSYQRVLEALLDRIDDWRLARPLHLLGQSTGAAIINHYLLRHGTESNRLIDGRIAELAPLVRAANWAWVNLLHSLLAPWKGSVTRGFAANSNDDKFVEFLRRDPLQSPVITADWIGALKRWLPEFQSLDTIERSLLIVQGEKDATVDWRFNLNLLAQKFPNQQALLLADARHQLANESEPLRQKYLDWLDQQGFLQPA
ncbi:alpha/beta hydrolase [Motiliproteus sp.]|uniref:alpha/beta hydrolase n=1 Tax=Motiliproteus sp. TaxID=1898955 RepID=UPI003BAA33F1